MSKIKYSRDIIISSACVLSLIAMELIFLRGTLFNDQMYGDLGDGRLCALITERWYSVFSGKVHWSDSLMFYPEPSLGYTDLFLGYGLIHSLFRLMGLDMYISFKLTIQLVHIFGVFSLFFLLKNKLKAEWCWSLMGTAAFSFCSSYMTEWGHPQLTCISMIPLLMIFIIGFFENYSRRTKRSLNALGIILTFVFVIYTAWYIAFFTVLFALLFTASAAVLFLRHGKNFYVAALRAFKANQPVDYIWYIALTVVLLIPFIKIYLPVIENLGGAKLGIVSYYLPEPIDFINVTSDNVLMGFWIKKLGLDIRGLSTERNIGISVFTLMMFFVSAVSAFKKCRESKAIRDILICAGEAAILLGMLFVVKLGSNGASLWYLIYWGIPGAGSLRAISRFVAYLVLPMSVVTAISLGRRERIGERTGKDKAIYNTAVSLLTALIFISDMRFGGVPASWSSDGELAVMEMISAPPEDIECFYVTDTSGEVEEGYMYQIRAFEISIMHNIPTINGYSGKTPNNWGMWDVYDPMYIANVDDWISRYGLKNVYLYNMHTNTWARHSPQ